MRAALIVDGLLEAAGQSPHERAGGDGGVLYWDLACGDPLIQTLRDRGGVVRAEAQAFRLDGRRERFEEQGVGQPRTGQRAGQEGVDEGGDGLGGGGGGRERAGDGGELVARGVGEGAAQQRVPVGEVRVDEAGEQPALAATDFTVAAANPEAVTRARAASAMVRSRWAALRRVASVCRYIVCVVSSDCLFRLGRPVISAKV